MPGTPATLGGPKVIKEPRVKEALGFEEVESS
jgi:hypothetical protein